MLFALPLDASAQMGVPYLADDDEAPAKAKTKTKAKTAEETPEVETETPTKTKAPPDAEPEPEPAPVTPAMQPAKHTPAAFTRLWADRRQALSVGDQKAAQALLAHILAEKRSSGWPNMFAFATALARETDAAIAANKKERAMELAAATVELAPNLPASRRALARAAWAKGETGTAVKNYLGAYFTTWSEPPMLRTRLGNLSVALLIAMLIACCIFTLVALYRHFRLILHDIHHVLPKGATRVQSAIFGVTAFLAPVFFRLGPVWWVLVWVTLLGMYYERRERVGATVVLALLAVIPFVLPVVTSYIAYPESRAEAIYLAARDMGAQAAAERLATTKKPSASELFVLGLRARWSGDLERASDLLSRAERAGSKDAVLLTTLGNIKFQLDDTEGAVKYYEQAIVADPDHAVAYFNLSRVYHSIAESKKANEAYRTATEIDYERVEEMKEAQRQAGRKYVHNEDVPRYIANVGLALGGMHDRTAAALWRWLGGRKAPYFVFSAVALGCVVLMVVMAWLRVLFKPSIACSRCGMPSCRRCNPEMKDQNQCGQCFHAFIAKAGVDPQARVRKEIEAHRFQARTARVRRVVSLMLVGTGQLLAGRSVQGLAFLTGFVACILGILLALGLLPELTPYLTRGSWLSTTLIGIAAVAVYVAGLWDTQRGERQ